MVEKADLVKEGIYKLMENYLGAPTAKTFRGFYGDENLPICADAALKILGDFIGHEKAKEELKEIFIKNHIAHAYV
jgi:hypothetical protein